MQLKAKREQQIFVSLTGGLGNQLFQLAAGLSQNKEEQVLISIFGNARSRKNGIADITEFTLPASVRYEDSCKASRLSSKAAGYLLRNGLNHLRAQGTPGVFAIAKLLSSFIFSVSLRTIVNPFVSSGLGFSPIGPLGKTPLLIGYFQTHRWASLPRVRATMQEMVIEKPGTDLLEHLFLAKLEEPLIVHVRLGDYKNEKDFGILSESYYDNAVRMMMDNGNYSKIWLFSDEPMLALEKIPTEFHHKVRLIDEIDKSPASTLELMRHGSGYIIANSSFSWWGAYLRRNNLAKVVAPSPWFFNLDDPSDLIPDNWIQLDSM